MIAKEKLQLKHQTSLLSKDMHIAPSGMIYLLYVIPMLKYICEGISVIFVMTLKPGLASEHEHHHVRWVKFQWWSHCGWMIYELGTSSRDSLHWWNQWSGDLKGRANNCNGICSILIFRFDLVIIAFVDFYRSLLYAINIMNVLTHRKGKTGDRRK